MFNVYCCVYYDCCVLVANGKTAVLKPQPVRCGLSVGQGRVCGRLAVVGLCVFLCIYHETIFSQNLHRFLLTEQPGGLFIVSDNGAGPGRCWLLYMECVSQDLQKCVNPVGIFIVNRAFLGSWVR